MQTLSFDQDIPSRGNTYLRVKQKGDKIQFRLAKDPAFVGKHFIEKEAGWDVLPCPRINSQDECEMCDMFFAAKAELKKLEELKDPADADKIKGLKNEARKYGCSIAFYFPILNRDTGKMGILQTTGGVRNKIKAQHEAGVNVFEREWILRNTGSANPGEIYSLIPVDSADVHDFTEEEVVEYQKAKDFDMMKINDGSSQSDEIE